MYRVVKKLVGKSLRPIIELNLFAGCLAMIDTGAEIPVWVGEEEQLAALDGVSSTGVRSSIDGFGGASEGNVYRMTWEFEGLHYIEMPVVACKMKNISWDIVLPATMFDGMRYTVDNIRGEMVFEIQDNQTVRHLKLLGKDGSIHIFYQQTKYFERRDNK